MDTERDRQIVGFLLLTIGGLLMVLSTYYPQEWTVRAWLRRRRYRRYHPLDSAGPDKVGSGS